MIVSDGLTGFMDAPCICPIRNWFKGYGYAFAIRPNNWRNFLPKAFDTHGIKSLKRRSSECERGVGNS